MKNFLVGLVTLVAGFSVQGQTISKVYDGTAGYCPQPHPVRWEKSARFIQAKIENGQLIVTPTKCLNGKVTVDETLAEYSYTSVTGVSVIEKHSGFKLLVSTPNLKKYKFIELPFFAIDNGARINLNEIRSVGKVVDINMQMRVDFETGNGYKDFNNLVYGAHRINF